MRGQGAVSFGRRCRGRGGCEYKAHMPPVPAALPRCWSRPSCVPCSPFPGRGQRCSCGRPPRTRVWGPQHRARPSRAMQVLMSCVGWSGVLVRRTSMCGRGGVPRYLGGSAGCFEWVPARRAPHRPHRAGFPPPDMPLSWCSGPGAGDSGRGSCSPVFHRANGGPSGKLHPPAHALPLVAPNGPVGCLGTMGGRRAGPRRGALSGCAGVFAVCPLLPDPGPVTRPPGCCTRHGASGRAAAPLGRRPPKLRCGAWVPPVVAPTPPQRATHQLAQAPLGLLPVPGQWRATLPVGI